MPQWLKMVKERRTTGLTIDQQRHVLYAVSEFTEPDYKLKGLDQVDVFDLGVLGNEFQARLSFNSVDLMKKVAQFRYRKQQVDYANAHEGAREFKLAKVEAIPFSESSQINLLLVT